MRTLPDLRGDLMEYAHHGTDAQRAELRIALADVMVVMDAREQNPAEQLIVPAVNRAATTTTDDRSADEVRAEQLSQESPGMHKSYITLSKEERAKGYVRPVRNAYRHVVPPMPTDLRDLTDEERAAHPGRGYVKFQSYEPGTHGSAVGRFWTQKDLDRRERGCNSVTTMGPALAETYARDPSFYGATYCSRCGDHFPVGEDGEFVWADGSGAKVGT